MDGMKTAPALYKTQTSSDGKQGIVEAFVSVFDNVDLDGDRVPEGAFLDDTKDWVAKAEPMPWIWSHNARDVDAFIGEVDPSKSEIAEFTADDGKTYKGWKVTATMPIAEDPTAAKAFRILDRGLVKQFSYAYDIVESASPSYKDRQGPDHKRDLLKLRMIECGPTLRGANPLTNTAATKGRKPRPIGGQKRGRTLSTANERALRAAVEKLQTVLEQVGEKQSVIDGLKSLGYYEDDDPSDSFLASQALYSAASVISLAGQVAPDADPAGDPDAELDQAQAEALFACAQMLSDVAMSLVSDTPPKSHDPGAREGHGPGATENGKADNTYAAKVAAELLEWT